MEAESQGFLFDEAEKANTMGDSQRVVTEVRRPGHTVTAKGQEGSLPQRNMSNGAEAYKNKIKGSGFQGVRRNETGRSGKESACLEPMPCLAGDQERANRGQS